MDISWGYPQTGAKSPKKGGKSGSDRRESLADGAIRGRRHATTSRKWPKTRAMMSIGPVQFECAKHFVDLLSSRFALLREGY